ncbi:MAG: LysM peptidoglycan-binding domain-containing protein [Bacteroidia bacterium]
MRKIGFTFLFVLITVINSFAQKYTPSTVERTINGRKFLIHKVEKSQSLYGIAKLYSVDLNVLVIENPEAIDGIRVGQELKIPTDKPKQPALSGADLEKYQTHTVVKGETVYSICYKYQITETQLTQLNPDVRNGLKEGAVLKIKDKTKSNTTTTNTISTVVTNTVSATMKDTTPVVAVNKGKKAAYNVGVFLPFRLKDNESLNIDELIVNKQNFPSTEQIAIDFYEGLVRAADSLKSNDFSINFKIYDTGERDSLQIANHTTHDNFKNLDLIIGPIYNSSFKIVASEAKKLQIPCVSPLTQQNKVLFESVFTSKTTPANNTLIEGLVNFCVDSLGSQYVVLVNSGVLKDQQNIKYFKQLYNEKMAAKGSKDTITEIKGSTVKNIYKSDKTNYFVVLTENEVFISDFVTHLNMFADKKENLRIVGMRKWLSYENLDLEYLNRFSFTYPAPYFIDNENDYLKKLNTSYRQKYYTDAGDYYYYGNDLGLYYFNLLKTSGPAFCTSLEKFPKKGTVLNFDFYHPNNNTGYENRSVQIVRYTEYKLKRAN